MEETALLSPYRVLDLTDNGAMLAGQILGDLGAEVILVEPPGGSELRRMGPAWHDDGHPDHSLAFWSLNRNKQGVTIDLETESGRTRLRELAATSDFLIESYPPDWMAGRGLGYEDLSRLNPRLIVVSITPFGQTGPKAQWAATDLTVWASARVMMMTGDADRAPLSLAVPQAFLHAGAEAAVGALAALTARERDGLGQHVDVSAQAATTMASQGTILEAAWNTSFTTRMAGGVVFGGIPLRFVNPAKDGYVSVTFLFGSALGPFARRLMEVLCEEGFVDEATRDKDWIAYTQLLMSGQEPLSELARCCDAIAAWTATHTKQELFTIGLERSLLIVPVSTMEDVANSEQLAAREFWRDVDHGGSVGPVRYPGAFAKFSRTPIARPRPAPALGEHSAAVTPRPARPAAPAAASSTPPFHALKVLDLMWVLAGPTGIRYLADYGATVIRIESTTRIDTARTIGPFKDSTPGVEQSAAWATTNAGKLGVTLSLTNPAARPTLMKLVEWADVVTESFTPGTMARLGLGYDDLVKVNPKLIMISSCLNGQTGPNATLAGFGTMGAQLAGFGLLAGWPDRPPAGPAGAYTDYVAPKFTGAAIIAALDHRRRTGEGQYIDLSQAEASATFLGPALLDYLVNGRIWHGQGNDHALYSPHGVYRAAGDDSWAAIAVTNAQEWAALCTTMGQPAWATDARFATSGGRRTASAEINGAIEAWTSVRNAGEIEDALQAARVPCHRAATPADALADPQLAHRGFFAAVEHPQFGTVTVEGPRIAFSRTPGKVTRSGPTFGQDNDYVLREILGMDDDAIAELIAAGALE
jgi:crotonobetainyl-CoA:carnitine CoA-transferase CaiB-like acyl-CoA transferase